MTVRPLSAVEALAPFLPARRDERAECDSGDVSNEDVSRLAQHLGTVSNDCVIAAMVGDRPELVKGSAAFLQALLTIWTTEGVDPATVWNELHARTEMGELLHTLSQSPTRQRTRRSAPWRVATSKLP